MVSIVFVGKCLLVEEGRKKILVIGDLHLGYEEALNKVGVYVPRRLFQEVVEELESVFRKIGRVNQVMLLGDVKHTFGTVLIQERSDVLKLIDYLAEWASEIVLIKGNHDVVLAPIAQRRGLSVRDFHIIGAMAFLHGDRDFPEIWKKEVKTWVVGHAHPAIVLDDGVKKEKYKCFLEGNWKRKKIIIVPSFAEHREGTDPRDFALHLAWNLDVGKFKVRVVGEKGEVLNFGALKDL